MESVTVGRCDCASWVGGSGRCGDPRAEGGQHRPDAGAAQRMIHPGVIQINRRLKMPMKRCLATTDRAPF